MRKADPKTIGYTVDTPVPYRLADLVALIDERMGKLENRSSRMIYHRLITRIETRLQRSALRLHVRERQCRRRHDGGSAGPAVPPAAERQADDHHAARRISVRGRRRGRVGALPHGLRLRPVERRRGAAAVRLRGGAPLRAGRPQHRLRPDAPRRSRASPRKAASTAFSSASSRSGRPSSTPTILSQCSTLFAMRMANDRDQAIVRSAVSDAAANLLAFLPSLGTARSLRLRRGRGAADAAETETSPLAPSSEERRGERCSSRLRHRQ